MRSNVSKPRRLGSGGATSAPGSPDAKGRPAREVNLLEVGYPALP